MGGWAESRSMVVTTAQCSIQREEPDARATKLVLITTSQIRRNVRRTRNIVIPPWIESMVQIIACMVMVKCSSAKKGSFGANEWGFWCTVTAIWLLSAARHTKLLLSVNYEILRDSRPVLADPVGWVSLYMPYVSTEIPGTSSVKRNQNDGFQNQKEINPELTT